MKPYARNGGAQRRLFPILAKKRTERVAKMTPTRVKFKVGKSLKFIKTRRKKLRFM